jgi:transketolase
MVHSANQLAAEIDAPVWSAPWIKPLDEVQLGSIAERCVALVTLEEHSVQGGLGAAVLEGLALSEPRPLLRLGIGQSFSLTCGSYNHALREHGIDIDSLRTKLVPFLRRYAGQPASTA